VLLALPCQTPLADLWNDPDAERQAAADFGLAWPLRGPEPYHPEVTSASANGLWRGQKFRSGSQRWANSGGKQKERYSMFHYYGQDPFFHPRTVQGSMGLPCWYMGCSGVDRF